MFETFTWSVATAIPVAIIIFSIAVALGFVGYYLWLRMKLTLVFTDDDGAITVPLPMLNSEGDEAPTHSKIAVKPQKSKFKVKAREVDLLFSDINNSLSKMDKLMKELEKGNSN